jgi:putative transposase
LKGDKSTAELAQIYGVHPAQISAWKKQLFNDAPSVFEGKRPSKADAVDIDQRRSLIDHESDLSIAEQCRLLGIARSTYYYASTRESPENLALMEQINRLYLAHPENGSRMMVRVLARAGISVNRKRVQRLMNLMGIRSLAPQRKTTVANKEHFKYPHPLRVPLIDRPNQVWCADITYVKKGFLDIVAIMDWHSRNVLTWRLANTMTSDFCVAALEEALALTARRRYSTPIRAVNSRQTPSSRCCSMPRWRSRWMESDERSTTCSSSGSGARSNTTTSI